MKYLYENLTKEIIGLSFETYNSLKFGYQEKYYQRAFEELLKGNNISYKKELSVPIEFKGRIIGRYFIDFLIDNKLVVEFKVGKEIKNQHIQQVLAYIKTNSLRLGLIILFAENGIKVKRIIN